MLVYVRVYACEMIEADQNNNEKPVQNDAEYNLCSLQTEVEVND